MTEKIEKQILETLSIIDGVNIGIERARELRERMLIQGEQETLGLDALIEILRKDKTELETALDELRRQFNKEYNAGIKPEIFEDGIDPDPDDWKTQSKYEGL